MQMSKLMHNVRAFTVYRAMRDAMQSAVMPWQVVCLSVCACMTSSYSGHIGWDSWKIISRLISLNFLLCTNPTSRIYSKEPQVSAGIRVGYEKWLWAYKTGSISETVEESLNDLYKVVHSIDPGTVVVRRRRCR